MAEQYRSGQRCRGQGASGLVRVLSHDCSITIEQLMFVIINVRPHRSTDNGRFPDNHFPGQDVSRIRPFPDNHFPGKTFPGRLHALTLRLYPVQDVSRTICIKNLEYFGMFNYFSFIIVSVCVVFIFHLITTKFTLYRWSSYTYCRPTSTHQWMLLIPTYRVTRPIELVFTHIMYMKILSITCPGNVCPGK